jgi:hypothetical protein
MGWLAACALAGGAAQADPAAQTLDMAAFEQLKSLAGRWDGKIDAPEGGPASVEFRVTSNGHAVIATEFPGTAHEMTTVYYLAHDRLQATHYCSLGNQPAFVLAGSSTPRDIAMQFAGGTGFDPAADQHAHGVRIETPDRDHLRVEWEFRRGESSPTRARMLLTRTAPVDATIPPRP